MLNRRLLGLLLPARGRIAVAVALGLLVTGTFVAQGVVIAFVIQRVLAGSSVASQAPKLLLLCVLLVIRAGLLRARTVAGAAAAEKVKVGLRRRLYAQLLRLGPAYGLDHRTGSSVSTLVDGVEALDPYVGVLVPQLLTTVVGATGIVIAVIVVDPTVGIVIVIACVGLSFLPQLVRGALARRHKYYWSEWSVLGADYLDAIQGMTTLKAMGVSGAHGEKLANRSREFYRASIGLSAFSNLSVGTVGFVAGAGNALAVGVGAYRAASGELTVLALLLVLMLSREAFRPLTELQNAYHASYRIAPAAAAIFAMLDASPAVVEAAAPTDAPTDAVDIAFDHVCFSYPGGRRPALDGVDFVVPAGQTLALVGRSGAGKSTAISLLLRYFDPDSGVVRLGGIDVRDLPIDQLRERIAVVAQDVYLFHGTVADNIGWGRDGCSRDDIESAARTANADGFIAALPDGYDTVIGERGLTLSGGERQRLAIARAVLKDAPVLVLDEATSAIDAAGERQVREALERLMRGRTTLVIAHRLSAVQHADRIVLLEDGRVIEVGDHGGLVSRGGAYARLVGHQDASA